jgi:predicted secreted protein
MNAPNKQLSAMSKRSLRQAGHTHIILPILAVVIVAAVGLHLISTHANAAAPVVPATITLVNADNNKTVTIKKTQKLVISLPNAAWMFSPVSNTAVLQLLQKIVNPVSSKYPSGNTTVSYKAIATGKSVISANATIRPVCSAHAICPEFIAVARYQLTVDVINK